MKEHIMSCKLVQILLTFCDFCSKINVKDRYMSHMAWNVLKYFIVHNVTVIDKHITAVRITS